MKSLAQPAHFHSQQVRQIERIGSNELATARVHRAAAEVAQEVPLGGTLGNASYAAILHDRSEAGYARAYGPLLEF